MNTALLTRSLDGRADVGRAIGVLMEQSEVTSTQALDILVRCAERVQLDIADVARVVNEFDKHVDPDQRGPIRDP